MKQPARGSTVACGGSPPLWLPACICCGSTQFQSRYPAHFPWLKQCVQCGLVLAQPQPSDQQLAEVYNADYYQTFGYDPARAGRYRYMKQASFDRLLDVAERYFHRGRLLDVGSALGDLLAVARRRGWQPLGIEPNPHAVQWAQEVAAGATFCGTLDELHGVEETSDLVTCVDVIEHLRRPDQSLKQMYRLLRPGGGLLVVTNDVSSQQARAMGPRWVHYHIDHLWYFSRDTLRAVAEQAGFEVLWVRPARKIFSLSYVLGILAHSPNHRLFQGMAKLGLQLMPEPLLRMLLPPVQEGLLLLARRPEKVMCQ